MRCLILCGVTALFLAVGAPAQDGPLRQTVNFNRDWRFRLGDWAEAQKPGYKDGDWQSVNLPHSFAIPCFLPDRFYTGYGWYRKRFEVPPEWRGKRISLEFDGAFQDAEVFLNGAPVGRHRGGYTGFPVDLTDRIVSGENVVAVRLNNLWKPDLAPRAGEHVFNGGLYRNVWLVATDPVHVAWCGTFVTTPEVSSRAATVRVRTEVRNDGPVPKEVSVVTRIVDSSGSVVTEGREGRLLGVGEAATLEQTLPSVPDPKLWSPEHPVLYRAATQVLAGGVPADDFETPFGIRSIRFTPDQGFSLNGDHLYLHGANVHQDHAGWGDAVTDAGAARDVGLVKGAGFNFIRGSHYPHSPAFLRACDERGVLFWSENAFWGIGGKHAEGGWSASAYPVRPEDAPAFEESVLQQLREMILIHRNHPSVIAWSTGNEDFFSDVDMGLVAGLLKKEVDLIHELDPTRPAACGGVQRPLDARRLDRIGDLAGYNGDGGRLPPFQDPGVPNLVSEYGSVNAVRPGKYDPGFGSDLPTGPEGVPLEPAWRSGQAIWCAFDHGSIAGKRLGAMGIIDSFRIPKRAYYWYREHYAHVPPPEWPVKGTPSKVALSADKTELASVDGTDDAWVLASILDAQGRELDSALPVTLSIESGPGEFPTGRSITFVPGSDIDCRDGKAAIEFRAYQSGITLIRATSPGLADGTLRIVSRGEPAFVEGRTPLVADRPYVRYAATGKVPDADSPTLALNRPTLASSSRKGCLSSFGNDGDPSTSWMPEENDASPRWQVFLENSYRVRRLDLAFPSEGDYRFHIDVSSDGESWRTVVDRSSGGGKAAACHFEGDFGNDVGYVRICFLPSEGCQPGLAECVVGGGK